MPATIDFEPITIDFEPLELGKDFLDQPNAGVSETSPATPGVLPDAGTETITPKLAQQQLPPLGDVPLEIGATPATIPRFGKEGTITRGVSDVLSGFGEFALNKPEELAMSIYPPTAPAIAARYLPEIGVQTVKDVGAALKGDKQALGRAMSIVAMIGGPAALAKARAKYMTEGPSRVTPMPPEQVALEATRPAPPETAGEPPAPIPLPKSMETVRNLPGGESAVPTERTADATQERPVKEDVQVQPAGDDTQRPSEKAGVGGGIRPAEEVVPTKEVTPDAKTEEKGQEVLTEPEPLSPQPAAESEVPIAATPTEPTAAGKVEPAAESEPIKPTEFFNVRFDPKENRYTIEESDKPISNVVFLDPEKGRVYSGTTHGEIWDAVRINEQRQLKADGKTNGFLKDGVVVDRTHERNPVAASEYPTVEPTQTKPKPAATGEGKAPTELYLSWSPKSGGDIMGESQRSSPDVISWAKKQIEGLRQEVKDYRADEQKNRQAYKESPNRRVMGGLAPESLRAASAKSKKLEAQAKIDFLKSRIAEHERIIKSTAKPTTTTPAGGEPSVGPGAASPESEFSNPTIDELIQPHLRPGLTATPEGLAAEAPPAQTLLGRVRDFFTTGQGHQSMDAIRGWLGTVAGKTLPKTTLADRQAGELGGRYVASRAAGAPMADVFVNDVLAGLKVDQAKFDAALKADNLLSIRDAFTAEAERLSQDPTRVQEAEVMQAHADHVNTLIGADRFPFRTEAELRAYFQEPEVAEAVRRHIDNWKATIEPLYRITQNIDPNEPLPTRGRYSGARINLNPIIEGEYEPARGTIIGSSGNILGTLRKRNPFARKAMGTGQSYVLNYAETMANSFARQLEIANKKAFEDRLVQTGNAVVADIGKHPTLPDGGKTKPYPLIRRGFQNKSIYVRDTLSKEYEIATNVVLNPYRGSLLVGANKAFAQAALAGLTDATVHIENLGTALFQVPVGTGAPLLVDSLLSAAGRMDIPVIAARMGLKSIAEVGRTRLMKYLPEAIKNSINKALLKNMTQMASIAQINASRVPHGSRLIGSKQLGMAVLNADKATRMVLDDTFRNLVKQGLVKGTETNRREFINQAGNYNLRAQGPWMRFLRQTYLSPFATAGRNFATLGVRGISLNPGVEASGIKAAAALRANMLAKWVGTAALVATANYLITGKLMGRKGTPLGAIDTGKNDANGRAKYFNVAAFTGQSRALRTVGARGAIEARRLGLKPSDQVQAAVRDVTNVGLQAVAGPGIRAAIIAATGYPPAVSVGRASEVVPPGESQAVANVKEAGWQSNPLLASIHEATKPGGNYAKAIERQLPRFTLSTGKPQAMIKDYPKIVSMAQANEFMEGVIHNARQLPRDQRHKFVNDQINRLEPKLRDHARQEALRRKVYSRP